MSSFLNGGHGAISLSVSENESTAYQAATNMPIIDVADTINFQSLARVSQLVVYCEGNAGSESAETDFTRASALSSLQ
ncbi:MAG: hypothetical protein HY067_12970 [Betaproteobacteria bacterium]|nr:hypothetical protein [Betaproteobacteria bacterium]